MENDSKVDKFRKVYKEEVSMRRVSILMDVADDVFDTLVEPLKKQKKLSEVIKILLGGYMNDSYIIQYVEGTRDAHRQKSQEDLLEALDSMNETLSQLAFSNEEAKSYVEEGSGFFKDKGNRKNQGPESTSQGVALLEDSEHKKELQLLREENEENKREIGRLRKEASETKEAINSILSTLNIKKGVINSHASKAEVNKPVIEELTEESKSSIPDGDSSAVVGMPIADIENLAEDDPLNLPPMELPDPEDDEEIDVFGDDVSTSDNEDEDFLNGLLEGQVLSF